MPSSLRLVLAGPQNAALDQAAEQARALGADVTRVHDSEQTLHFLREEGADLLLADLAIGVPQVLLDLRGEHIAIPVIACGISVAAVDAVAAVRAGALDFVPLPPTPDLIAAMLITLGERPTAMIGSDPGLLEVIAHARRFAQSSVPMIIRGEPGVGKETLARVIHHSAQPGRPFIRLECAGVSSSILASELFGHPAGTFVGAGARTGKLRQAAGGTLLIRNIDALAPELQAQLAAALPGCAARVIATTSANLHQRSSEGVFRCDLLSSLGVVTAELPPLRCRVGDMPALASYFAERAARREQLPLTPFSEEALRVLQLHAWPGNLRELQDVVQRAILLSRPPAIEPRDLVLEDGRPLGSGPAAGPTAPTTGLVGRRVEDVERELILQTLHQYGGNRTTASAVLGISVRTMRNKLKSFRESGLVLPAKTQSAA